MEVLVGSSYGISMAAYVRDRGVVSAHDKAAAAALFLADESGRGGSKIGLANQIGLRINSKSTEESWEDSSSSIGESENEEDDDVSYQGGRGALDSFSSSLEETLPMKRGLSNHYVGKSKSFGNLMEASNIKAKDLEKPENPFNKRRRLLIANKLRRRVKSLSASHFYTWQNPSSMPSLALQESNDQEDNDDDETIKLMEKKKRDFMAQTQSCVCLSSLQEEDEDDDE